MKTSQEAFHVMRGHMEDGCEIVTKTGSLFIRATMAGWKLENAKGEKIVETTSAFVIQDHIVNY